MKKLMFFALACGLLVACGNSKNSNDIQTSNPMESDTIIEIIGEWVEVPVDGQTDISQPQRKIRFNKDKSLEGTPILKTEKKKTIKKNDSDSITVTTMVYQLWDQQGDTITMISQSAVDPQLQDTVTWGIVTLTSDSLKLNNASHGTKAYTRNR